MIEPLTKPSIELANNIKMYLKEMGREVVDWIHLARDRVQW
jgi:hypothetical protein